MMLKRMFNCHEVSRLVSADMDTNLPLVQRILIRFHLVMCRQCARVSKQLAMLRAYGRHLGSRENALGDDLGDSLGNSIELPMQSRERIKAHLRARLEGSDP